MHSSAQPEGARPAANRGAASDDLVSSQDRHRASLRDLIALGADCSRRETAVERRYRTELQALETGYAKLNEGIEQRYQELKADIAQRYAGFLETIEQQYQADQEKLAELERGAHQRIETESATLKREVGQRLQQATWLADSVFEATQNQLSADARQSEEDATRRRQLLDVLEDRAARLLLTYGFAWAPPGEAPPPEEDPGFDSHVEDVQQRLAVLSSMSLPRLFVGVLPFVLTLLICGAAGLAAQILSGASTPQWQLIGISAGVALAVTVIVGLVLRSVARSRVEQECTALRGELDQARAAVQREYDQAAARRDKRHAESVKQRDIEITAARRKYDPFLGKAAEGREATLKAIQEERDKLVPRIEGQRQKSLQETEEWHRRAVAELEQGHDKELAVARARYAEQKAEIERTRAEGTAELDRCWNGGLAQARGLISSDAEQRALFPPWEDSSWENWTPPDRFVTSIRFGELQIDLSKVAAQLPDRLSVPRAFAVPALLTFPREGSLLIHADHAGRGQAIRTLQALMVRLLTSLPAGRVRFTIIDPVGLGQNFAGFMHLADYDESLVGTRIWTDQEHIEARLADLTEHMETVIQKYLRNEFETIDQYNEQAGELAEPYRFLVIADFPTNFSDVAVRRLSSIAGTGARCGVYTLVARDTRQGLPPGTQLDELEASSVNIVQEQGRFTWRDPILRQFPLSLDSPPSEEFLTRILHKVGRQARESKRVEVPFSAIAPKPDQLWSRHTAEDVEVPIGRMGATRLQTLRLGRGVAQHGLIAGKTGSGKSTLLHVLVTNLAMWYPPDEVEFYLVDFKKGVEFKAYAAHGLPHARAVAVESDREFGLSVLQRVDAELGRRGALFREAGVQDLPGYRQSTGRKMPRCLLIIDEFQEFFSEDDRLAQDAGLLLDRLVRQGRAFGIHVLLGSQTIGGTSGLARSTLGQMAVRIALQTSEADSQIILGDGNAAARLLSRPGEAVYNDAGGLIEANSPFQVAWLPDDAREQYLTTVRERAGATGQRDGEMVVFEGNVPADLGRNPELAAALQGDGLVSPAAPVRAWLGEPVSIKGPTAVPLRRQSGSNLLIVGQQEEAAMATLAAAAISIGAQTGHEAASFFVFDGSPADSPLAQVFPQLQTVLRQRMRLVEYRDVAEAIKELWDELQKRLSAEVTHPPGVYVLIYGLQRYRALRRSEDAFSFSSNPADTAPAPDRQFSDLLREGPNVGMHVLAWCDTPASVERTLDRSGLREFDYRVLFQMSASDSSNLIDSPLANKLGQNRALSYSEEQGTLEKFRPYALPPQEWLEEVRRQLERRAASGRSA